MSISPQIFSLPSPLRARGVIFEAAYPSRAHVYNVQLRLPKRIWVHKKYPLFERTYWFNVKLLKLRGGGIGLKK